MAMAGATRGSVRTLSALRMAGADDTHIAETFTELRSLTQDLAPADRALTDGEIAAVEHEFLIWRADDRMAADTRART